MVKPTKIILSILLLFALLAVSGCTDSNVDDASSDAAVDTDVTESEDNTASEEVDAEETTTEEADADDVGAGEENVTETVSTNATLHECAACHADVVYTMEEMKTGIHKEAFTEGTSAMHVDKCKECHTIEDKCASCHELPEIMKAQVTS